MEKVEYFGTRIDEKILQLEGGKKTTLVSSGKNAILQTILTLAHAGDEIVVCENLRPEVYDLFAILIREMGITVNFVQSCKAKEYVTAISLRTRCIFIDIEGGTIPQAFDVSEIAYVAHKNKIPLVVDASGISPYAFNPIEEGADIVLRDLSIMCGSDVCSGGSITEAGNFDWRISNVPLIKAGDPSCNSIRWAFDLPKAEAQLAFSMRLTNVITSIFDSGLKYTNAYFAIKFLDDIALNFVRRCDNASKVAKLLMNSEKIDWVSYPTVTDNSPSAKAYGKTFGTSVVFAFKGTKEESKAKAEAFLQNLKYIGPETSSMQKHSIAYMIGAPKKDGLVMHTRPSFFEEKENAIHFTAGFEEFKTLRADISRALKKA